MRQEHRSEKTTCVTEYSSCTISGVLQQMFSSEYAQSQQNTPQHCRVIPKPLVNAEKRNHNVSQEEEFATISKLPCTGKNKIPMEI